MNPLESLAHYLDRLERRLKMFAWARGAAAVIGAALILTVAIVASLMLASFSPSSLILGRFILFLGIGAAVAIGLVVPLMRLNRRGAAQQVEQSHPGFDQRLLTFTERSRDNASDPFLPLLAEDALVIAREAEPEQVIEQKRFIRFGSIGAVAAALLVYLIFFPPGGLFGTGAQLLWGSYPKDGVNRPLYSITVEPGSKTIRRKSDQMITASLGGFTSSKASVFVQYASSSKWEEAPMQPQNSGPGFAFLLVRVAEDAQYYVASGGIKSSIYKLHTIDLPAVKNIKVTYNYPSWTGLAPETEDPGGDLRAVEGTVAKLEIQTDKPLNNAQIAFEDGKPITLDASTNNRITANVPIDKDGTYHIAVTDHGELVRLTDDYFIEAKKVDPPVVKITKPGKDAKVSPIEEFGVTVTGEDAYPLQSLDLHYSVNGAPEKVISMLKQKGAKTSEGTTTLSMEEFKAVPGDVVSIYATAKDGKNNAKTDMFFVQAVPFEFEYSQGQGGGGGGGGGGADQQEQQISEREKEIIAATYNQINGDAKMKAAAAENGKYLSDTQAKLRDQAQSLANRTKARQLDGSGAGFQNFVKEMEAAVAAMTPASDKLKTLSFTDAMPAEQQALTHLLRAEATFRQIQVQVSRGGGGGGGGGGGAGRDLANLFDLELDKDKNQYETNSGSAAEQKQEQVDEAMKKLEDLARRQKALADQQQNNPQQLAQQRYEQEMLRREAEQLKREMEALQRGDQSQQGQQGQQSSSSSSSSSSSGQSGQSGQQSARNQPQRGAQGQQNNGLNRATQEQLQRAIKDLSDAEQSMSNSASARQPGQQGQQGGNQAQSEAQRAADRLKQSAQSLQAVRKQQNGSEIGDLANQAAQLAGQQQDFEQRLRRSFGQGQNNQQLSQQMAEEKQKMLDAYNNLQKGMQQAARDVSSTQPGISKELRDAMGRAQEAELGTRMEYTQEALRRNMGQYAVLQEAPVTKELNALRDQLKKLEGDAASQGMANGGDDKSQIAMQQALDKAESIRRQMEALAGRGQNGQKSGQNGQSQNGQQNANGNRSGNQQGPNGQQRAGNQNGQQPGGQQPGGQQQGNQQGPGQQAQGQQGQQGQGQQGGQQNAQGSRGGPNNQGGGGGVNTAPRTGNAGGYTDGPFNATNYGWGGDTRMGTLPPGVTPEQAYNDLMRDIGRLRASVVDDKDLQREYQDLVRRAQELDPRHMNNDPQLGAVIGAQALGQIDELELILRRKLAAGDGSVRSTSPRNIPPGYAEAVAEYTKRLSKQ